MVNQYSVKPIQSYPNFECRKPRRLAYQEMNEFSTNILITEEFTRAQADVLVRGTRSRWRRMAFLER